MILKGGKLQFPPVLNLSRVSEQSSHLIQSRRAAEQISRYHTTWGRRGPQHVSGTTGHVWRLWISVRAGARNYCCRCGHPARCDQALGTLCLRGGRTDTPVSASNCGVRSLVGCSVITSMCWSTRCRINCNWWNRGRWTPQSLRSALRGRERSASISRSPIFRPGSRS